MGCGLAAPEQEWEIARIVRVAAKPTHTLNGGMDHLGVRFGAAQSLIEGVGSGFSGHNRAPL